MRAHRVRTSRTAQAAIIGVGVAGALGTAAAIGVSTLAPTSSQDLGSPATSTSRTQNGSHQRTVRVHTEGSDDDGGWTRVKPPRSATKQQTPTQRAKPRQVAAPAPQAKSSGS